MNVSFSSDQVCLITDDGSEFSVKVAALLKDQGWKNVVLLRFPKPALSTSTELPKDLDSIILSELGDTAISRALQDIRDKFGPIGCFIHVHPGPKDLFKLTSDLPEWEKLILKQVFFLAKHLKKDLNLNEKQGRKSFMTLTRLNGKLGFGSAFQGSPVAGGLFGLVKTVNIEWPEVFCRAIDFDPEMSDKEMLNHLKNELYDPNTLITETGYKENTRVTLTADITNLPESDTSPATVDAASVFLVAGGAKGVTSACVIELGKRHQCSFILLGRSEFPLQEPEWAKGVTEDTELKRRCMEALKAEGDKPTPVKIANRLKPIFANREIDETLQQIRENGSKVEYVSADILNREQLRASLKPIEDKLGTITGVIHGAGVLADKRIDEKTEGDYDAVFSTKIDGLEALISLVSPENLKHLILFSSAAGFYGNEAQSDYATANEVLNKYAQLYKQAHPQCHVAAFNWGPWDGGMVTPALKRLFEERNINVIPEDVGSALMSEELISSNLGISQVVIGSSMVVPKALGAELNRFEIQKTLDLEGNPFLNHHRIGGEPVLPIICALAWMADTCEQLYPGYRLATAENTSVLKGIVFKPKTPADFTLHIEEVEKTEGEQITVNIKVSSLNPKQKPIFHYSTSLTLSAKKETSARFDNFKLETTNSVKGSEFYSNGTLFHDENFQMITEQLHIDDQSLTLAGLLGEPSNIEKGQFPSNSFNAYADDGLLQAMLIWARDRFGAASLPLKIGKGQFYQPTPFEKPFYLSLIVRNASETKLVADIIAHSQEGEIYTRLENAEVTISKALNDKF